MSNLQTLHILTSQSFSCVAQRSSALYCKGHNDTQNFVMFTIASDGVWKLGLGFVDGSVRPIRKTSSEIIPKQLRTKHATLEFLFAYWL